MTIDPHEYDLNELRGEIPPDPLQSMHDGSENSAENGSVRSPREQLTSGQYRELFLLESTRGEGDLSKPYLGEIPDSYGGEILVFEWLEFMLEKVGYKGTMDALRYYESINWVSERAESLLQEYAAGCSVVSETDSESLSRDDHLLSLVYIARLGAASD
jgi:flagellar protein FlaE